MATAAGFRQQLAPTGSGLFRATLRKWHSGIRMMRLSWRVRAIAATVGHLVHKTHGRQVCGGKLQRCGGCDPLTAAVVLNGDTLAF